MARTIKRKLTFKEKQQMINEHGEFCDICYQPTARNRIEVDHIIPLWNGGSDCKSNLQILCYWCHKDKSASETSLWHKLNPVKVYNNGVLVSGRGN